MPDFGRWTSNGGDPSLNDINRADRFIDALSTNQPVYSTDPGEAELAFLLADWRDDVREAPATAVVTERDALHALRAGQSPRRTGRLSLAVVGSAAAAVLCLGGFGTAVYGAAPGDGLYGVRTMLFGEQQATRDDQVVLAAQTELAQVQQLIDDGQWDQAQDRLVALSTTVQSVDQVEQKQELIEQWNALTYKVVEQDPAAALPPSGQPLPSLPDSPLTLLPVPQILDSTTTTATESTGPTDTTGPEVLVTPGPESVTTTPASTSSESPTSPSSSTAPSPSASTSTSTSSSTAPPSSATTTTATTATTTTTTTTTATTTTTTTSRPPAPPQVVAPPVSRPPISQLPAPGASTSPPAAEPSRPTTTSTTVPPSAETGESEAEDAPVTTTVVPPVTTTTVLPQVGGN